MGSAMRPRPWYGCSAPFMGESLTQCRSPHRIEPVTIDRRHRDDLHLVVALDGDLDEVAGAPGPELLVELLLRRDGHPVHAHDPVAPAEAGPERRADR